MRRIDEKEIAIAFVDGGMSHCICMRGSRQALFFDEVNIDWSDSLCRLNCCGIEGITHYPKSGSCEQI